MQNGETPGPDGYPIEFSKKFSSKLSIILLYMFNDSVPWDAFTEASVTFLLKPGKDSSHQPIFLLNCDVKIFAKALPLHLGATMHNMISADQTGFMLGHHYFTNMRRLLNVIHASKVVPEVVIVHDAEKAFDRAKFRYLFACLKKFGYGANFISSIKLLYTSPKVSVITNSSCQGAPIRAALLASN